MPDPLAISAKRPLFDRVILEPEAVNLSYCLTCQACISRCTWRGAEGSPDPLKMLRLAYLGLEDELGRAPDLWNCTMCNRCMMDCPMGVDMGTLVRRARALPSALHQIPEDFHKGIKHRLETGNVNGVEKDEYIETIEWLSEEFGDEVGDENAEFPLDLKGATYAYLPNPRELENAVEHFTAMGKLLYALGEPWTVCSKTSDVTNWGYYIGNDDIALQMGLQVIEAIEELDAKYLVLSECGHGFLFLKKYAERLLGRKPEFKLITMSELLVKGAEEGKLRFDKSKNPERVAYHDPCNIARKGGVVEFPRKVLELCVREVVELDTNRKYALCCGGGGGILQDSTSYDKRMRAGHGKALQMKRSGCKTIATSCLSCQRQLTELGKHYEYHVSVPTVGYLASQALIL